MQGLPRTVADMARRSFHHRTETFGLDTDTPWALPALRLLFSVPRAYEPLAAAWDARYPGTRAALDRLTAMGFVAYQGPVVIDTRTGELADTPSRPVARYRTTYAGSVLHRQVKEDLRVLEDRFARLSGRNVKAVARLLRAMNLEDSHAKHGISAGHAIALSGLPERSGRWWVARLVDAGLVRRLPHQLPDVREVVPAHWRVTRLLCSQLSDVIDAFPATAPATLRAEFRLKRSRFLTDIDPARVGVSGATDFDHDIVAQQVLAALLASPRCQADAMFVTEPRLNLPIDTRTAPWRFSREATGTLFYQPDALMREVDDQGRLLRSAVEYERYQTRRDAWSHIERFLGYLHTTVLPQESAVLRFVVDNEARERAYVELIEAFADYALEAGAAIPANSVVLAVSSVPRLRAAADPLAPSAWFRLPLPNSGAVIGADTGKQPVLHPESRSPYEEYFGRSTA